MQTGGTGAGDSGARGDGGAGRAGTPWPHPPAGWYPDPGGAGARWWDGYAWTEHTAPVPSGAQPAGQTPAAEGTHAVGAEGRWRWEPTTGWQWLPGWTGYGDWPQRMRPMVDAERRIGTWVRAALYAFAAASIGVGALRVGYTSVLAGYYHWIRLAWDAAQSHTTAPSPPQLPASYLELSYLASLVELGVGIAFLVWQHRAAATARWLGLPSRHTPGWGVAFWFIPVANFWCPYQALRDCLPPGHPARRLVLGCWLLYVAAAITGAGVFLAAGFSEPLGIALLVLLAGLWLSILALGRRLIVVVGDAHRAIVGG